MDIKFNFNQGRQYIGLFGEIDTKNAIKIYITPEMKKKLNFDEGIFSHHNRYIWDEDYRRYIDLRTKIDEKNNRQLKKIKKLKCI